jgi:ATP-binding cassette subfamily F protein 3
VLEELASVARMEDVPRLRGHLGAFLFTGDDVEKPVGVLSGGEKARLALAKMLLRPANFLVLDEPTNHLDVEACEVLEEALREYAGTFVVISHDRSFLNALATRVVEVRAGQLREFPGNYDTYLRASEAAASGRGAVAGHGAPHLQDGRPSAGAAAAESPPDKAMRQAARAEDRERRREREKKSKQLERLEAQIATGEKGLEEIGWRLADPDVYKDGERVRALEAERAAAQARVDSAYKEWERLAAELETVNLAGA